MNLKIEKSAQYDRQKRKLTKSNKRNHTLINEVELAIEKVVNASISGNHEMRKELSSKYRIKKIKKFADRTPPRNEATWSWNNPDGRLVWSIDFNKGILKFIYVGSHEVLDAE